MAAEIENISDFKRDYIETPRVTLEEKLENAAIAAQETEDSYVKAKLARSFIKMCLHPEMLDESDAISFIKLKIQNEFEFDKKTSRSIVTDLINYYKKLNRTRPLCNSTNGASSCCISGCEEIDPEDIDDDEHDFDQETLKRADEEAEHILSTGNPIKYIKESVSRIHVGDEDTTESMCISTAGQSILNTAGIQIAVNGESGSGKSDVAKSYLHHLPRKWKRTTSLSSKALYYMNLRAGMTIYSDDTDMDEDLATIFKQSTTNYQEQTYRTIVKDHDKKVLSIPPRINLLLTSVESHVSEQVLNRRLTHETDTSDAQKHAIYWKQKGLENKRMNRLTVTFEVLVCRRIFVKLKEQDFNVAIPFADNIELADYTNSRIQPLLFDMIRGYTRFYFKQRKTDDDGWLIATKEDFYAAKRLFKSRETNTVTKLTKPETEIVKYIISHQNHKGCTINDIAQGTNMNVNQIRRLLNGRNDRLDEDGGLLSKVKGMTKESVSDTDYVHEGGELIQSKGRRNDMYKIEDYNPWDLFVTDFITLHEDQIAT